MNDEDKETVVMLAHILEDMEKAFAILVHLRSDIVDGQSLLEN